MGVDTKIAESLLDKTRRDRALAAVGYTKAKTTLSRAATVSANSTDTALDADTYRWMRYSVGSFLKHYTQTANNTIGGTISILDSTEDSIRNGFSLASQTITDNLKPVSSFMGSTLGTMTGVLQDPLGSVMDLPNTLGNMLDRTHPSMRSKYEATFRKFNIDKLAELPKNVAGSIYHFVRDLDGLLSLPMRFVSDLYFGAMAILEEINDFIEEVFNMVQEFVTGIIDGLFPGLLEFLTAITSFANQIGGIVTIFSGANNITGMMNQTIVAANSLNSFIQNPMDLVFANTPMQVNQGLYLMRNPQSILNQMLPPELSQWMAKVSSVTGFGFNGNMGYGVASVLAGFRNGILSGILDGFASQYRILAPLYSPSLENDTFKPYQTSVMTTPEGAVQNVSPTGEKVATKSRTPVVVPIPYVDVNPSAARPINYLYDKAAALTPPRPTPPKSVVFLEN